jgi:ATP-binding cassette subfamily D (ALD) long-chain fatty acid import protein
MAMFSKPIRSLPNPARKSLVFLFVAFLLLRSRIFTAPAQAFAKLKSAARGQRLTPAELAQALQQVYLREADGSKTLLVPYRDSYLSKVSVSGSVIVHFVRSSGSGSSPGSFW